MPLNTRSVGDVINYVTRQFGDESGVQITNADIVRWINQGQTEINSKNLILRATATTPIVVGQSNYSKTYDAVRFTAVKVDNILLKSLGFDEYQKRFSGNTDQGDPTYWTPYGDVLIVSPPPNSSYSASVLTTFYIPNPTRVVSNGDTLGLPDRYFDRICEYVMSKAYELDEDWNAHSVQRGLLEKGLQELSNAEVTTQGPYPVVIDYRYDDDRWY